MKRILLLSILSISCLREGTPVETRSSVDVFKAVLLFEIDGCKIYRFIDDNPVYFSDCRGKTVHEECHFIGKTRVCKDVQTLNRGEE